MSGGSASVDLPQDLRDEIREFARALPDMSYYEMLGVDRDAGADELRDGFFDRSKVFHPDRYFGKQVGVYGDLLHEIYKQVVVAHDMLRDARSRAAYDQTLPPAPPSATSEPAAAAEPAPEHRPEAQSTAPEAAPRARAPETAPTPTPRTPSARGGGRSLRAGRAFKARTSPLSGLRHKVASGEKKAERCYDDARAQRDKGEFARAASLARLAVAYDPRRRDYTDLLGEILPKANSTLVTEAKKRGRELLESGSVEEAIAALTEASQFAPTDAALAAQLAGLCGQSGSLASAIDFANRAVQLEEENVGYLKLLARLYREDGQRDAARKCLQRAWELDPMDEDVKAALTEV
ncbi:MAG: tetratricopeptide repeat protein [Deltaproteobacteria bacterium]|nr:tetratricopeptide repeat protein [Deltaproteobacteria bacterium]